MTVHTRFCMPEVAGKGAGLGNELFSWSKAFLAAQVLNARHLHPAFGRNPRGYGAYFGTRKCDWMWHLLLRKVLPCYRFGYDDFLATGKSDYAAALTAFADEKGLEGKKGYVLLTPGMWGGFYAIRKAKPFVISLLQQSRGTLHNLIDLQGRLDPGRLLVGVHIRRGDFEAAAEEASYVGLFNTAIPLAWYMQTCRSLKFHFGDRVSFLLVTDGSNEEVSGFLDEFKPLTTFHHRMRVCSDMLALAASDLLVCSVSSFSMWGAFLSSAPYLWYRPNLGSRNGALTIWGHEPEQQLEESVTSRNIRQLLAASATDEPGGRGIPIDRDGIVPVPLLLKLEETLRQKCPETDLILYGATKCQENQQDASAAAPATTMAA